MTADYMSEAHNTVSRFRQDLRDAEKSGSVPIYLIDRAGTLVSDARRQGADERLLDDARRLAAEAMVFVKRQ